MITFFFRRPWRYGGKTVSMPDTISTQVLVVGSGAGGAVVAATLAEAGLAVVLAEEGPLPSGLGDLPTHSPQAMRLLYRNGGLSPILGKPNIAFVEGRCLGGTTEINAALWHRPDPALFARWVEDFGIAGLTHEKVEALCRELEGDLGVRMTDPTRIPLGSRLFRQGLESAGLVPREVPRAQASGLSVNQFAAGAKNSMTATFLPRARAAGAVILTGCRVRGFAHSGGRIRWTEACLAEDAGSRTIRIEADHVFVCGGAIQTPALLRRSGMRRNVGDTLQVHPMVKMAAVFDCLLDGQCDPIPIYQAKIPSTPVTLGGAVFTPGFLALHLADRWDVTRPVMRSWRNSALFYASCRGSACGSVRSFPGTGEALSRYTLSPVDIGNLGIGLDHLARALFAGGAKEIYPALRGHPVFRSAGEASLALSSPLSATEMGISTVHVFGTCPMGEDRARCAVDSSGRVHGFTNLYLSDGSILPGSPGVNPQGTIMALSLHLARRFLAERPGRQIPKAGNGGCSSGGAGRDSCIS
jgi:choline dehydrogenase-like flavoprotein